MLPDCPTANSYLDVHSIYHSENVRLVVFDKAGNLARVKSIAVGPTAEPSLLVPPASALTGMSAIFSMYFKAFRHIIVLYKRLASAIPAF